MTLEDTSLTPLQHAINNSHTEIVKVLLQTKANPNIKTVDGNPLLWSAAINKDIFQLMLEHGADPHAKGREGNTLLMFLVGNNALEQVKILLKSKPGLNEKNDLG